MSVLYSNIDSLDVGGLRRAVEISRTGKGVSVKRVSLYGDEPTTTSYYREYPELPADWAMHINSLGTTALSAWLRELDGCRPYRRSVT